MTYPALVSRGLERSGTFPFPPRAWLIVKRSTTRDRLRIILYRSGQEFSASAAHVVDLRPFGRQFALSDKRLLNARCAPELVDCARPRRRAQVSLTGRVCPASANVETSTTPKFDFHSLTSRLDYAIAPRYESETLKGRPCLSRVWPFFISIHTPHTRSRLPTGVRHDSHRLRAGRDDRHLRSR